MIHLTPPFKQEGLEGSPIGQVYGDVKVLSSFTIHVYDVYMNAFEERLSRNVHC